MAKITGASEITDGGAIVIEDLNLSPTCRLSLQGERQGREKKMRFWYQKETPVLSSSIYGGRQEEGEMIKITGSF